MHAVRWEVAGSNIAVIPFFVARAPVRRGIIGSFRRKAPVLELPSMGRPFPDWNRSNGVFCRGWIVLMVRTKLRGTLGQRNLGGRLNSLIDGLGGILDEWCPCDHTPSSSGYSSEAEGDGISPAEQ